MHPAPSIRDFVMDALQAMGIRPTSALSRTFALREGRLVAEKYCYGRGYAVWRRDTNVVEFYDPQGTLLNTLTAEAGEAVPSAATRKSERAA